MSCRTFGGIGREAVRKRSGAAPSKVTVDERMADELVERLVFAVRELDLWKKFGSMSERIGDRRPVPQTVPRHGRKLLLPLLGHLSFLYFGGIRSLESVPVQERAIPGASTLFANLRFAPLAWSRSLTVSASLDPSARQAQITLQRWRSLGEPSPSRSHGFQLSRTAGSLNRHPQSLFAIRNARLATRRAACWCSGPGLRVTEPFVETDVA